MYEVIALYGGEFLVGALILSIALLALGHERA